MGFGRETQQERGETAARPTVLIVEDNVAIASMLSIEVEAAGFSVAGPVSTARQARKILADHDIAVALLDINLGPQAEQDGARLADLLCDLGIPFIFVSAFRRESLDPALQSFAHLTKPIDAEALCRQLWAHLA